MSAFRIGGLILALLWTPFLCWAEEEAFAITGAVPSVQLENAAKGKRLKDFQIKQLSNSIKVNLKGAFQCPAPEKSATNIVSTGAYLEVLSFDLGPEDDRIWSERVFENLDPDRNKFDGSGILEFPISILKGTRYELDPLALFEQARKPYVRDPSRHLRFLQKNWSKKIELPFRMEAKCQLFEKNVQSGAIKKLKKYSVIKSITVPVLIKYAGDKSLKADTLGQISFKSDIAKPKISGPKGFSKPQVSWAFAPRNSRAKCPAKSEFGLEVKSDDVLYVQLGVKEGRKTVFVSQLLPVRKGRRQFRFSADLLQQEGVESYRPFTHQYDVELKWKKSRSDNFWYGRQKLKPFYWQHTCIETN